jgi:hypothetical protein
MPTFTSARLATKVNDEDFERTVKPSVVELASCGHTFDIDIHILYWIFLLESWE